MPIYTTLVVVSLSLGFWIGRARNRTHLVNLSRSRIEHPAAVKPAALLQPRIVNDSHGLTSLKSNMTVVDSCKMVGQNLPLSHREPFIILITGTCRSDGSGDDFWEDCSPASISCYDFICLFQILILVRCS